MIKMPSPHCPRPWRCYPGEVSLDSVCAESAWPAYGDSQKQKPFTAIGSCMLWAERQDPSSSSWALNKLHGSVQWLKKWQSCPLPFSPNPNLKPEVIKPMSYGVGQVK